MTERELFTDHLTREFSPIRPLSEGQAGRLYGHYELLCRWNRVLNLTTVDEMEEAVVRHYCESLFLGTLLPEPGASIVDLGSGGGFPGIPMAVLAPGNTFVLAESHQRKAVFLREATRGWANIRVFAGRAEDFTERADWIVSRAVQPVAVAKAARKMARHIGLLVGEGDVAAATGLSKGIVWRAPEKLPWGQRRVALIGEIPGVPRGT